MVNGNNALCFLFHCCCWCILSILRFLYIIHPNWLHHKFPETKYVTALAIAGVFLTFSVCFGITLGTNLHLGWPHKLAYEMPMNKRLISIMTTISNYAILTVTSCIFYILILRKRGRLNSKKVNPETEPPKEIPHHQQSFNSDVIRERPSTDIATIESISSEELFNDVSAVQEAAIEEAKKLEQRNAEINAAIRCRHMSNYFNSCLF